MNDFDYYTVNKIGEVFGIEESEKQVNDKPTKKTLQDYINRFLEESNETKKVDFFLFVYCGANSTSQRNQHTLLITTDDQQEEKFPIEAQLRKLA